MRAAICLVFFVFSHAAARAGAERLKIFSEEQPVSFFFRDTEAAAARRTMSYEAWETRFRRLAGVMGKMLDEEVLGRSAGQDYYRRFKAAHPDQAVLLHANGGFRSPLADNRAYHDGHWLYYNGARVLDAVPATGDRSVLRVSDPTLFNLSPYRANAAIPDDVGLCALADDGRPDWNRAEQTRLVAIDAARGTITIQRGLYGSTRQAFAAGRAYAAAHVAQTWGTNNKLWQFNMATTCPRDASGRGAADIWAAELIAAMRPGGAISYVDGFEFDVPFVRPIALGRGRRADCDVDGRPDDGVVAGRPVFALGVDAFHRTLRAALPDKLILADVGERAQRSVATLNGVETEGFPHLRDPEFLYWSTASNEQAFWRERARPPVFTYGLLKFRDGGGDRGAADVPFSSVRLALAGPVLAGSAAPIGHPTPVGANGVWDELVGGALQRTGWLGRAAGPARHLALDQPDLLAGSEFARCVVSTDATVRIAGERRFTAAARDAAAEQFTVRLTGLHHKTAGDIVVAMTATAAPLPDHGSDYYRMLAVAIVPAGAAPDTRKAVPASPAGGAPFQGFYYQRNAPAGAIDVVIVAEGAPAIAVGAVSVHAAPDCVLREYERGAILANPSPAPQAFALAPLLPGRSFRRLQATAGQDAKTNDGSPVAGTVIVPPKDALFLIRE